VISCFFSFKESLQDRIVIRMEKHPFVSHEQLHRWISRLCQLRNLLNDLRSRVSHDAVEGIVDHGDTVRIRFPIFIDGFYQSFSLNLIYELNQRRRAADCRRI
jgi:hypothetical protein